MNLLCPNCQKMLTVPEQYAGQLMKCPLCSGTFTVPALPAGGGEPPPSGASSPPPSASAPSETFALQNDPEPAFATSPPPAAGPSEVPAFASIGPPEPAFTASSSPVSAPTPPPRPSPVTPPASTPSPATGGYSRTWTLHFSDRVCQWIPLAAIVLILLLQLFDWVRISPNGVRLVGQGPWGAAFGMPDVDPDLDTIYPMTEATADDPGTRPSVSPLLIFYLLPFFLLTLAVTVAAAVLPHVSKPLPQQVQQLLPWKWAIIAVLNAILLLFLGLQMLLGFPLENSFNAWVNKKFETRMEGAKGTEKRKIEAEKGEYVYWPQRTFALRLTVLLHLLAALSAAYVYWMEKRGPGRPLPKLELQW